MRRQRQREPPGRHSELDSFNVDQRAVVVSSTQLAQHETSTRLPRQRERYVAQRQKLRFGANEGPGGGRETALRLWSRRYSSGGLKARHNTATLTQPEPSDSDRRNHRDRSGRLSRRLRRRVSGATTIYLRFERGIFIRLDEM